MSKKTIAISAVTVCFVIIAALSMEILSLRQELQRKEGDAEQSRKEMQGLKDSISQIGAKEETLTGSQVTPSTDPDASSNNKTYTSAKNKISFSYLSDFILTEKTMHTFSDGSMWNRISLSREADGKKTNIIVEVNPDGYGPIFGDKYYTLGGKADGTLEIKSQEIAERSEDNNDQWLVIVADMPTGINDQHYYFRLESQGEDSVDEAILKNLISSVKITK